MVKLIAFDLDGTVLDSNKCFSDFTAEAMRKAREKDIILVPATGRIVSFIPREILEAARPQYILCSNGASVIRSADDKEIYSACLSNKKARQVQSFLDKYNLFEEYYYKSIPYAVTGSPERAKADPDYPKSKHIFLQKPYRFTESFQKLLENKEVCPEKINLSYLPEEIREEVKLGVSGLGGLSLSSSIPDNLEINSEDATKGKSLQKLCELLGIDRSECMALGDGGNDVDMLKFAGLSFAMDNACNEAAEAAKYHTDNCDNNGAAKAILKMI